MLLVQPEKAGAYMRVLLLLRERGQLEPRNTRARVVEVTLQQEEVEEVVEEEEVVVVVVEEVVLHFP